MRFQSALAIIALALLSVVVAMPHPAAIPVAQDQCPRSSVDEALLVLRTDPAMAIRAASPAALELEKRGCCTRCSGKCTATQRVAAVSKGNGCGPAGWWNKVIPEYIFGGCCNGHDICYTKCSNSKATCDNSFGICMVGKCKATYRAINPLRYICTDLAAKYLAAVKVGGCSAFQSASKRHCKC